MRSDSQSGGPSIRHSDEQKGIWKGGRNYVNTFLLKDKNIGI